MTVEVTIGCHVPVNVNVLVKFLIELVRGNDWGLNSIGPPPLLGSESYSSANIILSCIIVAESLLDDFPWKFYTRFSDGVSSFISQLGASQFGGEIEMSVGFGAGFARPTINPNILLSLDTG